MSNQARITNFEENTQPGGERPELKEKSFQKKQITVHSLELDKNTLTSAERFREYLICKTKMEPHKKGTSKNNQEHLVNKNVIVTMGKKKFSSIKPEKHSQGILNKSKTNVSELECVRGNPVKDVGMSLGGPNLMDNVLNSREDGRKEILKNHQTKQETTSQATRKAGFTLEGSPSAHNLTTQKDPVPYGCLDTFLPASRLLCSQK